MPKPLSQYRYNRYSQNGEDGVIEEICRRLNINQGWFVEFGAWDGKHLSNTYNLLLHGDWRGVFIEGNPDKYQDLLVTQKEFPGRIYTLCAMVGFEGENRLDSLLSQTPLPREFDLLSIDIDSYDFQVWEALVEYRPKIVVIENNSLVPRGVLQVHNPPEFIGSSFSSTVRLGNEKGYTLACHTGNCIFIRNELAASLDLPFSTPEQQERLFDYSKHLRERALSRARKLLPQRVMNFIYDASNKCKRICGKR